MTYTLLLCVIPLRPDGDFRVRPGSGVEGVLDSGMHTSATIASSVGRTDCAPCALRHSRSVSLYPRWETLVLTAAPICTGELKQSADYFTLPQSGQSLRPQFGGNKNRHREMSVFVSIRLMAMGMVRSPATCSDRPRSVADAQCTVPAPDVPGAQLHPRR